MHSYKLLSTSVLQVQFNDISINYNFSLKCLGLLGTSNDYFLTFKKHLKNSYKLRSRVNILQNLNSTRWEADTQFLNLCN